MEKRRKNDNGTGSARELAEHTWECVIQSVIRTMKKIKVYMRGWLNYYDVVRQIK